jgi:hypothetical protein
VDKGVDPFRRANLVLSRTPLTDHEMASMLSYDREIQFKIRVISGFF